MNTPDVVDIARALGTPVQAVAEIVRLGTLRGEITQVGEDGLLYTPSQLERVQERMRELAPGGRFTPKQFREGLETTRKYSDALLYHFDEIGFTLRTTEGRTCRSVS